MSEKGTEKRMVACTSNSKVSPGASQLDLARLRRVGLHRLSWGLCHCAIPVFWRRDLPMIWEHSTTLFRVRVRCSRLCSCGEVARERGVLVGRNSELLLCSWDRRTRRQRDLLMRGALSQSMTMHQKSLQPNTSRGVQKADKAVPVSLTARGSEDDGDGEGGCPQVSWEAAFVQVLAVEQHQHRIAPQSSRISHWRIALLHPPR
jgi:hypothetical protein